MYTCTFIGFLLTEIPGYTVSSSHPVCVLFSAELPEPAVRGICKLLGSTLHRYHDHKSRALVATAVRQLAAAHGRAAGKHLPPVLAELARPCSAAHASYVHHGHKHPSAADRSCTGHVGGTMTWLA